MEVENLWLTLYKALFIFLGVKQTINQEDDLKKYLDSVFAKLLKKVANEVGNFQGLTWSRFYQHSLLIILLSLSKKVRCFYT